MTTATTRVLLFERKTWGPFQYALLGLVFGIPFFLLSSNGGYTAFTIREDVARANAIQRQVQVALESYQVDFGVYPPGIQYTGEVAALTSLVPAYLNDTPPAPFYYRSIVRHLAGIGSIFLFVGIVIVLTIWLFIYNKSVPSPKVSYYHVVLLWTLGIPVLITPPGSEIDLDLSVIALLSPSAFFCLINVFAEWIICLWQRIPLSRRYILASVIVPILVLVKLTQAVTLGYLSDSYAKNLRGTESFKIATNGTSRWILQDTGPDGVYGYSLSDWLNLSDDEDVQLWQDAAAGMNPDMIFYDPTNGTISSGDIFRSGPWE